MMGYEFLGVVWRLKQLSPRHRIMALFAAAEWSLEKLKDESLTCDHSTPDLMIVGAPPPEIGAAVDPGQLN